MSNIDKGGAIVYSARVGTGNSWELPVIQVQGSLNASLYTETQLDAAALGFIQALAGSEPLSDGLKSYPSASVSDDWSV